MLDQHLKRMEDLCATQVELLRDIKSLITEHIVPTQKILEAGVDSTVGSLAVPREVTPPVVNHEQATSVIDVPQAKIVINEIKTYAESFNELKNLIESDSWPQAIDPDLICNDESDDDKDLRAEGIIEFLIDESLEGKRFLDFGCGDGHVVKKALEKKPFVSMGYDVVESECWGRLNLPVGENHAVTTDWDQIVQNGPYDVVLLYDVLDHLDGNQVATLKKLKTVMPAGGRIYVRCHPWCSRHATHLYKKKNKAFLHLIFTDIELARLGLTGGLKTEKIIHPHMTYKQWFNDASLDLVSEYPIQENLEDFFHLNPIVNERIKDNWRGTSIDPELAAGKNFPAYQLRLQFIDTTLRV